MTMKFYKIKEAFAAKIIAITIVYSMAIEYKVLLIIHHDH